MPPAVKTVAVVGQGLVSAYGDGVSCCADGLLSGSPCLTRAGDSFSPALREMLVGRVEGLGEGEGRLRRLLERLFATKPDVPKDARVYVATTVGEIDALETDVRKGLVAERSEYRISDLGARVAEMLQLPAEAGVTFSAACASSTAAVALAASAIRSGELDCVCVIGCDIVSEFTLSGFAALMALDARGARPFDADRKGITLGEAAAYILLMSQERAEQEGRTILGTVQGWGMTCDANHLTGPSRDGLPLADAVEEALHLSGHSFSDVTAICAHGTGTSYNDQMEMLAFHRAMKRCPVPLFSVKGGMGHTLGAAGVVELLLSLEFLKRGMIPGTVGLSKVSPEAEGWASPEPRTLEREGVILTTNSGFGGVNVALILGRDGVHSLGTARQLTHQGQKDLRTEEGKTVAGAGTAFVPPKNFTRFSAQSQKATMAIVEQLPAEGLFLDGDRILRWRAEGTPVARVGLLVWNREGSFSANKAYFSDYVKSGSLLGRGQLFAATLPTSVAAEVAIALCLKGPVLYVADREGSDRAARGVAGRCITDGLAEAMILLDVESGTEVISMKEGGL